MAGLVPAIHDLFSAWTEDVDARDKRGHDEAEGAAPSLHRRQIQRLIHQRAGAFPVEIAIDAATPAYNTTMIVTLAVPLSHRTSTAPFQIYR
jgi:hypothetical protein